MKHTSGSRLGTGDLHGEQARTCPQVYGFVSQVPVPGTAKTGNYTRQTAEVMWAGAEGERCCQACQACQGNEGTFARLLWIRSHGDWLMQLQGLHIPHVVFQLAPGARHGREWDPAFSALLLWCSPSGRSLWQSSGWSITGAKALWKGVCAPKMTAKSMTVPHALLTGTSLLGATCTQTEAL